MKRTVRLAILALQPQNEGRGRGEAAVLRCGFEKRR